jgi:hypothetical protein
VRCFADPEVVKANQADFAPESSKRAKVRCPAMARVRSRTKSKTWWLTFAAWQNDLAEGPLRRRDPTIPVAVRPVR